MPNYTPRFTPTVSRVLASDELPIRAIDAVLEFIQGPLAQNPHRVGSPLTKPPLQGKYRAARNGYRILYRIDDATSEVWIEDISSRSNVYRRRR